MNAFEIDRENIVTFHQDIFRAPIPVDQADATIRHAVNSLLQMLPNSG